MPEKSQTPASLALEIMPTGLSLITYEDDTPLECLAHAPLDDPEFDAKVGTFRKTAEATLGKGFMTQIWLSDEHLRLHCAMLRATQKKERRQEAASALSAMSPFDAKDLCFDLGATDSEGYTPIAAIPKEKLEEAMAFARKIQLNPAGVTTSDDVVGFAARPEFAPLEAAKVSALPARVAGIAALLALPVIGWSGGLFDGLKENSGPAERQVAFVATVGTTATPSETLDLTVPAQEDGVVRPAVAREVLEQPAPGAPVSVPQKQSFRVDTQSQAPQLAALSPLLFDSPHLRTVSFEGDLPSMPKLGVMTAEWPRDVAQVGPRVLGGMMGRLQSPSETVAPIVRIALAYEFQHMPTPASLFSGSQLDWRDARPRVDTASASRLPLTEIRNTAARAFAPETVAVRGPLLGAFDDSRAVQVANIAEGVLVTKPPARTRVLRLQPSFTVVPAARPGPKLPEQAFDFESLVPLTTTGQDMDQAPGAVMPLTTLPQTATTVALSSMDFDTPVGVTADLRSARIARAERLAGLAPALAVPPPRNRDAVPALDNPGALVQTTIAASFRGSGRGDNLVLNAPEFGDVSPRFLAAARLNALSLDIELERAAEPVEPLAEVAGLPRPPQRPISDSSRDESVSATPDLIAPPARPQPETTVLGANLPADVEPIDPGVIAAQNAPELRLSVPPTRPGSQAAALNEAAPAAGETDEATTAVATAEPVVGDQLDPGLVAAQNAPELRLRVPPTRPVTEVAVTEPTPESATAVQDIETAGLGAETADVSVADVAENAVALARPPARPKTAKLLAAVNVEGAEFASPQAVPVAVMPISRPGTLAAQASRIRANRGPAASTIKASVDPTTTTPSSALKLPTSAQVARVATIENGINLGGVSLIGIFGTANARRALVRLPQGRYVQVKRGDRVRGWTVSAISDDNVRVQKGSQNSILRMPQ